ncbi:MAG: sialate O-acetylesterase [Pirellulales bacterium]|nr:sialate O-acetylesterase [Pirellulales bacterium]
MKIRRIVALAAALTLSLQMMASADVKLPNIFGSHMVLQQEQPIRVFGWADAGEEVTVSLGDKSAKTKAGSDGKWRVELPAMKADGKAHTLRVSAANKIELTDVLLGEVWICSGQSNMEWSVKASMNAKEEIAAANHPQIRLFNVRGHIKKPEPQDDAPGQWQVCSPQSVVGFSAVGYSFGRKLNQDLKMPIGLIGSNWGGTRIEPWTPPVGFDAVEELKGKKLKDASGIYNGMIHPLKPISVRGAIWYQGESNGNEGESYYHKMQALIKGWRSVFENDKLAFGFVQLADFRQPNENPAGGDGWAKLREAQRKTLTVPNTGMAVIIDLGDDRDIHPRNKQDVGDRLARWAEADVYGKDVVGSGPLFKDLKIDGSKAIVSFDHVGSGLIVGNKDRNKPLSDVAVVKDGKLNRFAVAGDDKQWHWADAVIDGDKVVVTSDKVAKPVAVRYAYSMNPKGANLYNKEGLPASPFRSDSW